MIIHDSHRRPVRVRVVGSRLPVYEVVYGDGFGDVIRNLVTRIAPKAGPLLKQFAMKAVDVVKDKTLGTVGDLTGKAFHSIKDRLSRLVRRKKPAPVILPSTEAMPVNVSKEINIAANKKLAELVMSSPAATKAIQDNITANLIAGSSYI